MSLHWKQQWSGFSSASCLVQGVSSSRRRCLLSLAQAGVGGTRVGTTWRGAVPAHLHKRVFRCGGERRSSPSSLALWAKSSLRSFVRCLCLQCSRRQHSSPGISGHLFVTSLTNCISNFLSAFLILISHFSSYESAFQGWNYFSEGFFV